MSKSEQPNILFILTDQHRHDFAGFAGNSVIRTPNLDKLAADSVVFRNAYCQNPLCVPSRSSLLTGCYSRNIGIYENQDILEPQIATIPGILSQYGYRTCLIGKAHFNGEQYHGYQQRPYGDIFGQAHQPDPCRDNSPAGLGGMINNAGVSGIPLPMTQTEICVAESAKWLQEHTALHRQQPFMLSINFDKPHFPLRAPAKFLKHYRGKLKPLCSVAENGAERVPFVNRAVEVFGGFDEETEISALEGYGACIEWVDDAVGRILEMVDYLELRENTIIIYSSDHGELAGQYGAWNKTLFFDASCKVPLLLSWPRKFVPRSSDALVGLIDLLPTLGNLTGCEIIDTADGVSLLPLLTGEADSIRTEIFAESAFLGAPQYAGCMIRRDEWKYNYYLDGIDELYHLQQDPQELHNLAADARYAELKQRLKKRLLKFWEPKKQPERTVIAGKAAEHKHCYRYSNQFIGGNGVIFDAVP